MKEINILILNRIFEIFCLVFFIIITYFMWKNLNINKSTSIVKNFSNYVSNDINYYVEKYQNFNKYDSNLDYTKVIIHNNTNNKQNYKLLLAIPKNNDLHLDYLKIKIDENIYYLNDLYYSSDNYVNYYTISEGLVAHHHKKTEKIIVYLDKNKNFDLQFRII